MKRLAMVALSAVLLCNSYGQTVYAANRTWAQNSIKAVQKAGVLSDDLAKKATAKITRLEFCKMATQFYKKTGNVVKELPKESPFTDCQDEDVLLAYAVGFVSGVEPGKFLPNKVLTREELATFMVRLFRSCGVDLTTYAKKAPFPDLTKITDTSRHYIEAMYGAGLISGCDDGLFRPDKALQVQEAAVVFENALKFYEKTKGTAKEENEGQGEIPKKAETNKEEQKQNTNKEATGTKEDKDEIPTPEKNKPTEQEGHTLLLSGKKIALGQTKGEVERIWGKPVRIDHTVYDLERYIYQPNAKEYLMVTWQDERVAAVFAVAEEFAYNGMEHIQKAGEIAEYTRFSYSANASIWKSEDAEICFYADVQGNIRGVSMRENAFSIGSGLKLSSDTGVYAKMEKELWESINTLRAIDGKTPLVWDEYLHESAAEHSKDMQEKGYFAYNSLDGKTPFHRMKEKEKDFHTASEVIIRVTGDVPEIYAELTRTAGKYHSVLDTTMTHGGIGIVISSGNMINATIDLCGIKQ